MGFLDKAWHQAKTIEDGVNEIGEAIGETVVEGVCSIRNKYPNAFRRGGVLTPIMDRLCSDNGYPPPDSTASFSGGQCPGVSYSVTTFQNASEDSQYRNHRVEGRVNGIRYDYGGQFTGGDGNTYTNWTARLDAATASLSSVSRRFSLLAGVEPPGDFDIRITDIERVDGLPDDCGDPPDYAPDPPIDEQDFTRTVTICGTPNNTEDQKCVDIAIDFSPVLDQNGNQCYLIDGVKYCFTPDGVEKQDDGQEDGRRDPQPDELEPDIEEDAEESEDSDEAIRYVTTEITTLPHEGKTILFDNPLDNDYFAGYFSWTIVANGKEYRTPQIPIRKAHQVFVNDISATGYRIYTVNGAKLKVTKYKAPQKE